MPKQQQESRPGVLSLLMSGIAVNATIHLDISLGSVSDELACLGPPAAAYGRGDETHWALSSL